MFNHKELLEKIFESKIQSRTMTRKWSTKFKRIWNKCVNA